MSLVVNLLGGSGLGKSTTAALVFGELKLQDKSAELIQEYAKEWAWAGRRIKPEDQDHILTEQHTRESRVYGKVDFIITDSPLILGPVYEKFYSGSDRSFARVYDLIQSAENSGVRYMNFVLNRNKKFNPQGRFETEDQAKAVDNLLRDYLIEKNIPFHTVQSTDRERVSEILHYVLKETR